jgi:hypothetical protein
MLDAAIAKWRMQRAISYLSIGKAEIVVKGKMIKAI